MARSRPPACRGPVSVRRQRIRVWVGRRRWPLLTTGLTLVFGMWYSLYWGDDVQHAGRWDVPGDLWFTLRSSLTMVHGHLGQIYAPAGHLITLPGILLVLAPAAELVALLHLPMGMPFTVITYPTAWVVAGPYEMVVGSSALFALDTVAERLGAGTGRRAALSVVQAAVLAEVDVVWGHPEDALAVALLLWGALAVHDGAGRRGAWLLGLAVATQPLVVLALPAVVLPAVMARSDRWPDRARSLGAALVRIAAPALVLLAGPLVAAWSTTVHALLDQPNPLFVNHPTPWVHLSPPLGPGVVAAGPGRMVSVALAVLLGGGLAVRARHHEPVLCTTLAVVAVALALRGGFEPVLVPYYLWPALAVGLSLTAGPWIRPWQLLVASLVAVGVALVSLQHWTHPLLWWFAVLGGEALVVAVAWPGSRWRHGADGPHRPGAPVRRRWGELPVPVADH